MSEASDAGISELHSEAISTMEAVPSTSREPIQRQETLGREATRLIDGLHIDDMVNEMIQVSCFLWVRREGNLVE